jgi:hypothetical protein
MIPSARFFLIGWLLSAAYLTASPDPDLFDGRAMPPSSVTGEAGGEDAASGAPGGAEEAAAVSERDYSQIGEVGGGESVGSESSKSGESEGAPSGNSEQSQGSDDRDFGDIGEVGGGESVESESSKSGASSGSASVGETARPTAGGSGGSVGTGEPSEEAGSVGSASGVPATDRNFEDFGFGSTAEESSTVDVNRSKSSGTEATPSGSFPSGKNPQGSGTGGSGSAPSTGSSTGDYGSNLPSGL